MQLLILLLLLTRAMVAPLSVGEGEGSGGGVDLSSDIPEDFTIDEVGEQIHFWTEGKLLSLFSKGDIILSF